MTDQRYYLCEFRLDGRRLYVVWYSNDKDGLARLADGKIASFADESQVHALCRANGLSLMPEPTAAHDFDLIDAWCRRPTAEAIDPSAFLDAWNMLEDALSVRFYALDVDDIAARRAEKIYDKLFFGNNLPAITPAGASYEPIWSHEEIETLSRIYPSWPHRASCRHSLNKSRARLMGWSRRCRSGDSAGTGSGHRRAPHSFAQ